MSADMEALRADDLGQDRASYKVSYSKTLAAPGNGEWILFPKGGKGVSVILNSTGDGRVEATTDSIVNVEADSVAAGSILAWPHGDIGIAKLGARLAGVTAFRQVNISGLTSIYATGDN